MAISTITQTITPIPIDKEIVVGQKNLPENIQWFASAAGMPQRSSEINTIIGQFNPIINQINATVVNMTTLSNLTIQYEATTKNYVNTCLIYKNASETAYQNTVNLINATDITGTAGYTIDAVDSIVDDIELEQFLNFNLN